MLAPTGKSSETGSDLYLRNQLLRSLPRNVVNRLVPNLKAVTFKRGDVIGTPGKRLPHVYFGLDCVISTLNMDRDGMWVDGGIVGREGVAGLPVFLADGYSTTHHIAQVGGTALRLPAPIARSAFDWGNEFRGRILAYTNYFIMQMAQTALCNRLHMMSERLARWLLMTQDAIGADQLPVTQEMVAQMLGVHRPGVTIALGEMADAGVIECSRGLIHIVSRASLEKAACPCYEAVRREGEKMHVFS